MRCEIKRSVRRRRRRKGEVLVLIRRSYATLMTVDENSMHCSRCILSSGFPTEKVEEQLSKDPIPLPVSQSPLHRIFLKEEGIKFSGFLPRVIICGITVTRAIRGGKYKKRKKGEKYRSDVMEIFHRFFRIFSDVFSTPVTGYWFLIGTI